MWLNKVTSSIDRVVGPLSRVVHFISLGALFLMMLLTAADVILRYFFNRPITGSYDLTQYMMAILVASALAYCVVKKRNVVVELVVERLPLRVQIIIGSITSLLSVGFLCLLTWKGYLYANELYNSGIVSVVLRIPNFPFAYIVSFGVACLTLVSLADFLHYLSKAVKR